MFDYADDTAWRGTEAELDGALALVDHLPIRIARPGSEHPKGACASLPAGALSEGLEAGAHEEVG